jgi:hypothetical protein
MATLSARRELEVEHGDPPVIRLAAGETARGEGWNLRGDYAQDRRNEPVPGGLSGISLGLVARLGHELLAVSPARMVRVVLRVGL